MFYGISGNPGFGTGLADHDKAVAGQNNGSGVIGHLPVVRGDRLIQRAPDYREYLQTIGQALV